MRVWRTLGAAVVALGLCGAPQNALGEGSGGTTLLGVDGPADSAEEINQLLQAALLRRVPELEIGPPLAEIRLALNCSGNDAGCLSQGGAMLDATELVYAAVVVVEGGNELRLWRLDAAGHELLGSATTPLPEPGTAGLDSLLDEMVGALFGEPVPPTLPSDRFEPEAPPIAVAPSAPPADETELVWGPYSPRPRWKIAAAAASGVVFVGGVVMWAVAATRLGDDGPIRNDLVRAAADSLVDTDPSNDVSLDASDLCEAGESSNNTAVLDVCRRNTATQAVGYVGVGFAVVGFAALATFTTLLFVQKRKRSASARWRPTLAGSRRSLAGGVEGRF